MAETSNWPLAPSRVVVKKKWSYTSIPLQTFMVCTEATLTFDVRKSVHHQTIQIIQPTECNSFTTLLLDVYMWLNMFWALPRPSSRAYNCISSFWFYCWNVAVAALIAVVCQTTTNNAATTTLQR
jgi:hypothetical protein